MRFFLRGRSFYQVPIPPGCSWSLRRCLKLRDVAKRFLHFELGNGQQIHLWYDSWHPYGGFFDRYGYRIIHEARSNPEAKLCFVISNDNWNWFPDRSDQMVDIQSKLCLANVGGKEDILKWSIDKSGCFSSASSWQEIRKKHYIVNWWKLIWFPLNIPKACFYLLVSCEECSFYWCKIVGMG